MIGRSVPRSSPAHPPFIPHSGTHPPPIPPLISQHTRRNPAEYALAGPAASRDTHRVTTIAVGAVDTVYTLYTYDTSSNKWNRKVSYAQSTPLIRFNLSRTCSTQVTWNRGQPGRSRHALYIRTYFIDFCPREEVTLTQRRRHFSPIGLLVRFY